MSRFGIGKGIICHGGGLFRFVLLANLALFAIRSVSYADDLDTLCGGSVDCQINGGVIITLTNNTTLIKNAITITNSAYIRDFVNNGTILLSRGILVEGGSRIANDLINTGAIDFATNSLQASIISGDINAIDNSGTIGGGISLNTQHNPTIKNTGVMGGIDATNQTGQNIMINNTGTINLYYSNSNKLSHLIGGANTRPIIQNYAIKINENQATFNAFSGYGLVADKSGLLNKTAHFVISGVTSDRISFNAGAKIYIDIDLSAFELGKTYALNKIITNENGANLWNGDIFSLLKLKNEGIFELRREGDYFIIGNASSVNTPITELYKTNIKVMNNMFLHSNAMIFRDKYGGKRASGTNRAPTQMRSIRRVSSAFRHTEQSEVSKMQGVDSQDSRDLDSSLTLFAQNDKVMNDSQDSRLDSPQNAEVLALDSLKSNEHFFYSQSRSLQTRRTTSASSGSEKYYFLFTPFFNHNYFYEAGNYNLSGFDGGFITAFSGKLDYANTLGVHFGFGYGSLSDKDDKDFSIKNANLMLGLNYRLDLVWDMYIKARGDLFAFFNEVSSNNVAKIKPNNVGFGISASYGKDFNFKQWGVLGVELGVDYKMLNSTAISVKSALDNSTMQDYAKSLYNLIYLDLGAHYDKYFSTKWGLWGLNAGLGIRGNLAPKLAKSTIIANGLKLNAVLDNDKILGYVSVGGSYMMNFRRSVMEFSVLFNGNYGDRSMSNGGSFEWRVRW